MLKRSNSNNYCRCRLTCQLLCLICHSKFSKVYTLYFQTYCPHLKLTLPQVIKFEVISVVIVVCYSNYITLVCSSIIVHRHNEISSHVLFIHSTAALLFVVYMLLNHRHFNGSNLTFIHIDCVFLHRDHSTSHHKTPRQTVKGGNVPIHLYLLKKDKI